MRIEVSVPNLPESVSDATLLDWHKQPGETVKKSENLVDLETDKVILEVPVPETGILCEVRRGKGDVVASGDLLAIIETEVVAAAPIPEPQVPPPPPPATEPTAPKPTVSQAEPVSPAVRRLLLEHGLAASDIATTGRLTKQDVLDHLERLKAATSARPAAPAAIAPVARTPAAGDRRVPMTRLRATIAERLIEAQRTTATLTTFNEVNLQKIFELRSRYRARFEEEHKVKLGFMSFFVKATVEALKRFPIVNASLDGDDIVYHDHHDIGLAVSTERGLVVPVLRGADHLVIADIERALADFSKRAREGKLRLEELTGGTFTITNGGVFGSLLSTPILNPPQSAILGMHAIKERPVAEDGQVVIRPMIYLALSYDHRLIDGREAVSCLFTIKELLEDPARLLLGV